MPHLVVEASPGVIENKVAFLDTLVSKFSSFETITASDVKSRFYEVSDFVIGLGGKDGFLHLEIDIMEGRELAIRTLMVEDMFALLRSQVKSESINVTLELREMTRAHYRK